jgi:hypothetical protein
MITPLFAARFAALFLCCWISSFAGDDPGSNNSIDPKPRGEIKTGRVPESGTYWRGVLLQSGFFLGVQHAFRFSTEPGTRAELRGKFWPDYVTALKGFGGWEDTDPGMVNYVGHPMQGAVTGFIFTNNNGEGRKAEFGKNRAYWMSRLKAMGYTAAYSTFFELSPGGETGLGNLGGPNAPGTSGWVDIVITPVAGAGVQVIEDALDRFVVRWIERKVPNRFAIVFARGIFNPARSFANIMRLKVPWHRDTRPGYHEIIRLARENSGRP